MTPDCGYLYIAYIGLLGAENKSTQSQLTLLCDKSFAFEAIFGTGARVKTAYSEHHIAIAGSTDTVCEAFQGKSGCRLFFDQTVACFVGENIVVAFSRYCVTK